MYKTLESAKERIKEEIKTLNKKEKLTTDEVKCLGEFIDMLKDISTIEGMDSFFGEENYSGRTRPMMNDMHSYDAWPTTYHGMSGAPMRSPSTGRFTSRNYSGRYSYDTMPIEDKMIDSLNSLMEHSKTEDEKMKIREAIARIENM